MSLVETLVGRILTRVAEGLLTAAGRSRRRTHVRGGTRALLSTRVAEGFLSELTDTETANLQRYIESPEFEAIAVQMIVGRSLRDVALTQLLVNIREELRQGVRHAGVRTELLTTAADVLADSLTVAAEKAVADMGPSIDPVAIASAGHLVAAAAANSRLLGQLESLTNVYEFAAQLRAQVRAAHGEMRLYHLGASRSVPYDQLFVQPTLRAGLEGDAPPSLAQTASPGRRYVLLGDPGAGKSTLAVKLAHDIASDLIPGAEDRVPFLLAFRDFAGFFREGGRRLAQYLERVCEAPYNVKPVENAVDYLLSNGRAVVILDGLDELVARDLRTAVVMLIETFVHRYPLVPVLVTARRTGYAEARLDPRLFRTCVIAHLEDNAVRGYARNWFGLRTDLSAEERDRTVERFFAESAPIRELRENPLLLTLLCEMYASEQYIPRNLAQIYQRCTSMLFDHWDQIRGIRLPLRFRGRVRGAVQHLAWQWLLTADPEGPMRRSHVVHTMVGYLTKNRPDDEAEATAADFVDFCAGRPWILIEVQATETEPMYGFTHRTFLEYFAAEHLVRMHPAAEELWEALRPRVLDGEWDVACRLALQMLDRNPGADADELLRGVLAHSPENGVQRGRLNTFAARALGYVHPEPDVQRSIVAAAVRSTLDTDVEDRLHYWTGIRTYEEMDARDGALHAAMYDCAPANLAIVRNVITEALQEAAEHDSDAAPFVINGLSRHFLDADTKRVDQWQSVREHLIDANLTTMTSWQERWYWYVYPGRIVDDFRNVMRQFGPRVLYMSDTFLTGSSLSWIEYAVDDQSLLDDLEARTESVCWELTGVELPWIPRYRWMDDLRRCERTGRTPSRYGDILPKIWHRLEMNIACLLSLPYLETIINPPFPMDLGARSEFLEVMVAGRRNTTDRDSAHRVITNSHLSLDVQEFLRGWLRNDFDVLGTQP